MKFWEPKRSRRNCPTPICKEAVANNKNYKRVYISNGVTRCDYCGGVYKDGKWEHKCSRCGKEVKPGELCGLFVPHLCNECEEAVAREGIASGDVCGMCGKPRSRCYC